MAMTKKNFVQVADTLRAAKPSGSLFTDIHMEQWEAQVVSMADMLAATNPQFKRDRWLEYVHGRVTADGRKLPK